MLCDVLSDPVDENTRFIKLSLHPALGQSFAKSDSVLDAREFFRVRLQISFATSCLVRIWCNGSIASVVLLVLLGCFSIRYAGALPNQANF